MPEYRAQIGRIGRRLAALFAEDPRLVKLVLGRLDAPAGAPLHRARQLMAAFTARYLHNGVDRGFLRPDLDVEITARILNATILEALPEVAHASDPVAVRERWIETTQHLVFEGIAARPCPE